jgi:Fic family protein
MYNWQLPDWPHFKYDTTAVEDGLITYAERIGKITGMLQGISPEMQTEALISGMVAEAIKTSEIEGEYFSRKDIMSSIRYQFGMQQEQETVKDARAEGISELMIAVGDRSDEPLTAAILFEWHVMLMKGNRRVQAGQWRVHSEPMQVVSGTIGKETVHFEAPPSGQVPEEMERFIQWVNATAPNGNMPMRHAVIRSAIAHLYFETIHPFEDGNGRIGRAISDRILAQHAGTALPISLSQSIEADRDGYYNALKVGQRSNTVTAWLVYFVRMTLDALREAEDRVHFVLRKAQFFDRHAAMLSTRQLKVVRRMLEEGPDGFEGGMNARKYGSITGASKATATRDLQDLSEKRILIVSGGGRSTGYQVNF